MRGQIGMLLAALAVAQINRPCRADGINAPEPRFEVYTGAYYDGRSGNLNSSFVWGVFSPVTQPGFRLKLDGITDLYGQTNAPLFSSKFMAAGLKNVSNLMAGYQFNYGRATIKLYAGAAYEVEFRRAEITYPFYASVTLQQETFGAAAAFQAYWPVGERVWASLDVTWVQPDQSAWIYSRSAYEFYRSEGGLRIGAGAEANFTLAGDPTYKHGRRYDPYKKYLRGGTFLNLRYGSNDLSLSAGLSQASDEEVMRPYAGISYGRQF
jgi:hypothetical protein